MNISTMWGTLTPEYEATTGGHTSAQRRQVVTDAVAALLGK